MAYTVNVYESVSQLEAVIGNDVVANLDDAQLEAQFEAGDTVICGGNLYSLIKGALADNFTVLAKGRYYTVIYNDEQIDFIDHDGEDLTNNGATMTNEEFFALMSYDAESGEALDVGRTWENLITLTTPPRDLGLYEIKISGVWEYDENNERVFLRYRVNGGTWIVFETEPKDTTDLLPELYLSIYYKTDTNPIIVEVEGRKGDNDGTLNITAINAVCERKG